MSAKRTSRATPADQAQRDRFVGEIDRSFSVIAPAGVGKTRAIVDRIVTIATSKPEIARERLPRLVVVTYTKKAAEEMYQRARNAIIEKRVDLSVLSTFNQAFFGTIHSFCVRLLRTHGHLLGLPAQFEALDNDEESWTAFVRQLDRIAPKVDDAVRRACLRLVPAKDIFAIARRIRTEHLLVSDDKLGPPPAISIRSVLDVQGKGSSIDTIKRSQEDLKAWYTLWTTTQRFAAPPKPQSTAKTFVALWESALEPLMRWRAQAVWELGRAVAADYREFRIAQGQLTFDDQIDLAFELVTHKEAIRTIRREGYSVLVDEAQDTDPTQFNILLEIARPESATSLWSLHGGEPPGAGRFCMVGDPQQSIYSNRADLSQYQRIRERFVASGAGDELTFDVTFRCDRAIIDAVNALAKPLLNGEGGQASYSVLRPRPDADEGCVIRWVPPEKPSDEDAGVDAQSLAELRQLAAWLTSHGPHKLGASSWSEVAILCPRTRWLQSAAFALEEAGLAAQIHSDRSIAGDSPAYAWFTALMAVLADPGDTFELVGLLREMYGISDEALAAHVETSATPWTADATSGDNLQLALRNVAAIRAAIDGLPLRDAAQHAVLMAGLRERLLSLPVDLVATNEALDALLARAAREEADGASLADFAQGLQDDFEKGVKGRPVQVDAIQLFTCHMAKGLQWDVVILPMLHRTISYKPEYPMIMKADRSAVPRVIFTSGDMADWKEVATLKQRQELERLLYVALTRAKRTMVLVDDGTFFDRKKPNSSFVDILRMMSEDGHAVYNKAWMSITDSLPTRSGTPAPTSDGELPPFTLDATEVVTWEKAARIASSGLRRVLPYALAEKERDGEARTQRVDEPAGAERARAYGIWWHEMMEAQNWSASRRDWEAVFAAHLASSPDETRAQAEWKAFLASEFAVRLETLAKTSVVHAEMPILLRRSDAECIEGVIDLAIFDPASRRWLLADWKTNVVTPTAAPSLRELYAPQLGAYVESLTAITGLPVESGVYSTATGLWVDCP